MMKVAITTVGTRGDFQPYIALGLGLKKVGYEVLIFSAKNEESFVRNYGLDFYALGVDIKKKYVRWRCARNGQGQQSFKIYNKPFKEFKIFKSTNGKNTR